MHVELASIFSAGLNTCLAITLAHDGTLDENTMKLIDLAGDWLRARRAYLANAVDYNDVAILLGSPGDSALDWPGGGARAGSPYDSDLLALERSLRQNGYLPQRMIQTRPSRGYDAIPPGVRTVIVPDRGQVSPRDRELIEGFVRAGGTLLGLGRGGTLAAVSGGEPGKPAGLFGVNGSGYGAVGFEVLLGEQRIPVPGPALHLRPEQAATLLWGEESRIGALPFLTRDTYGKGRALLAASAEGDLTDTPAILKRLWSETIGKPVFRVLEHPDRYTVRIRRLGGRTILHIIDTPSAKEGPMDRYRALYTHLALNSELLPFTRATVVPDNRTLQVSRDGEWNTMELFPDPELTIVLE
jgi:hypothetical protein